MRTFPIHLTVAAMLLAAASSAFAQDEDDSGNGGEQKSPPHAAILKDSEEVESPIRVYRKGSKLFAELNSANYASSSEYIVLISIAKGIGQGSLLGGMSWGFGDDWLWQFRKVDDKVHVIRKNVRFKADKGHPEEKAVANAYTDSVLFSLPIITKGPKGGDLVDLTPVFMSDLPQISQTLPGFAFSPTKSTWAKVKGFPENLELEVDATYASSGQIEFDTVPDSRGVNLFIHYSISKLPSNGYSTRPADDRVGYFLTVRKDYSKDGDEDQFVRYINRWHLEKPPGATTAPYTPKEPIVFWIEKTVPHKYRKAVRDGIAEWNLAFEKAGWINAIEVRQQPDDADWDPEDIRYNTFRWITSSAGFAMGPSRVNPYTGQILDADIIFDADFLTFWKHEYETLTPESVAAMTGGALEFEDKPAATSIFGTPADAAAHRCMIGHGKSQQFAFGAAAVIGKEGDARLSEEEQERLIQQGLKEVVMHEVGHTLGLRHNFKASTWRSLKDLNDSEKAGGQLVASVMDYNPTNIVPKGAEQGDYYNTTIGPYDYWAIEYGYKPAADEKAELAKIAARSGEPGLAYATDEDTTGTDPDPYSNRFDMGADPLEYAKARAKLVSELMPGLVERMSEDGEDYTHVRRAFNILLSQHGQSMFFASRLVGGVEFTRAHKGDEGAGAPFESIDPQAQREALGLLEEYVFSEKPFQFPTETYNYLAPSTWSHWGQEPPSRKDFPVHDYISMWQGRVLSQLLSSVTLDRIHDTELKIPADKDAFTTAELIERLTAAVFSELEGIKADGKFTNRQPAIHSLRRNLQREYLVRIGNLALGKTSAPEDCQTIAYAELSRLADQIGTTLENGKLDSYSRAHLTESKARIEKVLDASITLSGL